MSRTIEDSIKVHTLRMPTSYATYAYCIRYVCRPHTSHVSRTIEDSIKVYIRYVCPPHTLRMPYLIRYVCLPHTLRMPTSYGAGVTHYRRLYKGLYKEASLNLYTQASAKLGRVVAHLLVT